MVVKPPTPEAVAKVLLFASHECPVRAVGRTDRGQLVYVLVDPRGGLHLVRREAMRPTAKGFGIATTLDPLEALKASIVNAQARRIAVRLAQETLQRMPAALERSARVVAFLEARDGTSEAIEGVMRARESAESYFTEIAQLLLASGEELGE